MAVMRAATWACNSANADCEGQRSSWAHNSCVSLQRHKVSSVSRALWLAWSATVEHYRQPDLIHTWCGVTMMWPCSPYPEWRGAYRTY
jgi:hypothetical protein